MKVLITGGLGHIGSELIRSEMFRESVTSLQVVDSLVSERYCSLFDLPAVHRLTFGHKDVRDLGTSDLEAFDAVIHLAAETDATASLDRRRAVFANNLEGTRRMVDLATKMGTRLIFASTTSVYGSQSSRVDETCPDLVPQSPYAECKLQEEALIRAAVQEGLDGIILRLGTIAGPSPGMRFHTAVNKFCLQARLGEPLSVWRTAWQQVRPYLDVDDAARVLTWAVTASVPTELVEDPVFNVVTENLSVEEIVACITVAFGPVDVKFTDSRIMNQLSYEIASDRIAGLGFRATGSISDAISRTARLLEGVSS